MSLLDSGVIAIKDGQLVSESDRCRQGTGGWFELEDTDISFWGGGFGKNFNSRKKNAEKKASRSPPPHLPLQDLVRGKTPFQGNQKDVYLFRP